MPLALKKVLKLAKGFQGRSKNCNRLARNRVEKGLLKAYIGRKLKKREFRQLWITRIQAATRQYAIPYSTFINQCKESKIELNRKNLAELAINEPLSLEVIIKQLQKQFICKKILLSGSISDTKKISVIQPQQNSIENNQTYEVLKLNTNYHGEKLHPLNPLTQSMIRDFSHKQVGHLQTSILSNFNPLLMKWRNWRTAYENAQKQYYLNYYKNSIKDPLINTNEVIISNEENSKNRTESFNQSQITPLTAQISSVTSFSVFNWPNRLSSGKSLKNNESKNRQKLNRSDNNSKIEQQTFTSHNKLPKFSHQITIS